MYKHILLPTDGSKLSSVAVQAGVHFAAALGARVTGFFAAPPPTPVMYRSLLSGYAPLGEQEEMIRKAAAAYLEIIEKAARRAGVDCEVMTATNEFAADAIVAAARKRRCDLIFMASHGRRGVRRESLLGSETQKVLSQSPIAVLVHR